MVAVAQQFEPSSAASSICFDKEEKQELELGIEPAYSDMGCRCLNWCLNYSVKCPSSEFTCSILVLDNTPHTIS